MINESMTQCRYCGVTLDPAIVAHIAETQAKANQAYSDASYLRTAAVVMLAFLGLSFIPIIPLVGWAFLVTFVVVLVLLIRWQIKFGNLNTSDPDYSRAKRFRTVALVLWFVAILVGFVVRPLLIFLSMRSL
jgi:hypothetical protein